MQPFSSLALLLFLLNNLIVKEANGSLRQLKLYEFQKGLEEKFPSHHSSFIYTSPSPSPKTSAPSSNTKKSDGWVIYPLGYGADPTGTQDSSEAIMEALDDALKLQNGLGLLPGISDLGGVIIDFQGGNYRINNPLVFPPGIGNVVL